MSDLASVSFKVYRQCPVLLRRMRENESALTRAERACSEHVRMASLSERQSKIGRNLRAELVAGSRIL